jgi:hypothetical protein
VTVDGGAGAATAVGCIVVGPIVPPVPLSLWLTTVHPTTPITTAAATPADSNIVDRLHATPHADDADHDGHGDTDGHHRTTIIRSLFSRYSNSWSSSQRTSTTPAMP